MKIKGVLTYMLLSFCAFATIAQDVEYDDMYFNAKDRAKLQALKADDEPAYAASAKKAKDKNKAAEDESLNPTDSYSARNVNPEFAARSNAETAKTDNEDYYVNDYQYSTTSNLNNWNNNFNNWYSNPWYSSNYYGSSINSWNSPYYGYSDPYYSPWYDPYWNYNGWSASFSYYWGNSYNYGWGGNYNYWNRPYCGWASSWGPSWYGNPYYYNYPRVIVVNNYGEGRYATYGKRNSRSSESNYSRNQNTVDRSSFTPSPYGSGSRSSSTNGRSSGTNSRSSSDEYYNRTWRRVTQEPASSTSSSDNSGGRSSSNSSYNYNNSNNNSSWNRSNESRSYSPSPSRSSSSFDGGSRSSGGSSSGSSGSRSSGSHSRSRGN